jgi:hypothetical protein
MSDDTSGVPPREAARDAPSQEDAAPPFWAEFDGAYRALLASVRERTGGARGAMKIRTRDAAVLVSGIALLLDVARQQRAPAGLPRDPADPPG